MWKNPENSPPLTQGALSSSALETGNEKNGGHMKGTKIHQVGLDFSFSKKWFNRCLFCEYLFLHLLVNSPEMWPDS